LDYNLESRDLKTVGIDVIIMESPPVFGKSLLQKDGKFSLLFGTTVTSKNFKSVNFLMTSVMRNSIDISRTA
jgi:hypothetical protein